MQEAPLNTQLFIDFCKKLGIETNKKELEFFERESLFYPLIRINRPIIEEDWIEFSTPDGNIYCRHVSGGLKGNEKEVKRYKKKFYFPYQINEGSKNTLLKWIKGGILFDPSTKPFQEWSSFIDQELSLDSERTISLYSSYQVHWLAILKLNYTLNINFAGSDLTLSSPAVTGSFRALSTGSIDLKSINDLIIELQKCKDDRLFKIYFDFEYKKMELKRYYGEFNRIFEFLLSIQNVYAPYGRSGAKNMRIIEDGLSNTWEEKRRNFSPIEELKILKLDIKDVMYYYRQLSENAADTLGGTKYDWMQLWKNIRWDKKDNLEGAVRLGIEYLKWALMLKQFIEDYFEKEMLDIDEIINIDIDSISEIDPNKICDRTLRGIRNKRYSCADKNYYSNTYKRLFYLSNSFGLDYQPRVIVFVEGYTEEEILPKFFEWRGIKPEYLGIEFMNFEGVDKMLSTSKTAEELRNLINRIQDDDIKAPAISTTHRRQLNNLIKKLNDARIIISNWTSFISYNLEKWQIIPFFVSDNEGENIMRFLEKGGTVKYNDSSYNIPPQWRFVWGIDNDDNPFVGNSFEFANFSDNEIALAVSEVIGDSISPEYVTKIRSNGKGIIEISSRVKKNKIKICNQLYSNLHNYYQKTGDEEIFNRPIFKLIEKITNQAVLNHMPANSNIESENINIIENTLKGIVR